VFKAFRYSPSLAHQPAHRYASNLAVWPWLIPTGTELTRSGPTGSNPSTNAVTVERGWERIDFQVLDWNPAHGFYRRLGIEHVGDWLRSAALPPRICPTGVDPTRD
jgi:hypothetical protein